MDVGFEHSVFSYFLGKEKLSKKEKKKVSEWMGMGKRGLPLPFAWPKVIKCKMENGVINRVINSIGNVSLQRMIDFYSY